MSNKQTHISYLTVSKPWPQRGRHVILTDTTILQLQRMVKEGVTAKDIVDLLEDSVINNG